MARYDRYDEWRNPPAFSGWYPGAFWAGGPLYGWGGMGDMEGTPAGPWGGRPPSPRRPPSQSPSYGRGGDLAARRWAERHGYDAGFAIPPRDPGMFRTRPPYDRHYQRSFQRWW